MSDATTGGVNDKGGDLPFAGGVNDPSGTGNPLDRETDAVTQGDHLAEDAGLAGSGAVDEVGDPGSANAESAIALGALRSGQTPDADRREEIEANGEGGGSNI